MTDKELIKQEIEYRLSSGKYSINSKQALEDIIVFIDSLPEESGCEVNFTTKSDDLEEEIQRAYYDKSLYDANNLDRQDFNNIAHHFAEWYKHHMKEALQTEYEKGRFDMREEMMKDSFFGVVSKRLGRAWIDTEEDFDNWLLKFDDLTKVKIIIIKQD